MRSKSNPIIFVLVEDHKKAALLEQLIEQYHPKCHLHFFNHWIDLLAILGKTPNQRLPSLIILSVATKRTGTYNVVNWLSLNKHVQHIPTRLMGNSVSEAAIQTLFFSTEYRSGSLLSEDLILH
jgi:hypothetical protein